MKKVFISYSSIDVATAETVRNVLEKNGIFCWMAPRDIPGGSNYTKEIPVAIKNCEVFVLILSKNAQSSQWVLKELDSAVNCGKVILPFMLEDCILNDEFNFLLTGAQRYAAYQKTAEAMEKLIARIRGILGSSASDSVTEQPLNIESNVADEQAKDHAPAKSQRPPKTSAPIYITDEVCPACDGRDLRSLPKRVKRQGLFELSTMLLIPALAIVGMLLTLTVAIIALPTGNTEFVIILGAIAGGFCGNYISKIIVKRRRIRKHLPNTCYRCNACGKVFLK